MDNERLAGLRAEYSARGLDEPDTPVDPLQLFVSWLNAAIEAEVYEPNAMVVATVGRSGNPSARLVLLKSLDSGGFVFYTNYTSRKGADLQDNPQCALVFPWHTLHRQVRVEGVAERLTGQESSAYFSSRPRGSQLGAWASAQSTVVPDRAFLEREYAAMGERWSQDAQVPRPEHWGGYRVRPSVVEFWHGRPDRMHDRIRFHRLDGGQTRGREWRHERLAP